MNDIETCPAYDHYHITCKFCRWSTIRSYPLGGKPDMDCRAEFSEHVSSVHKRDHPFYAWWGELAMRFYIWAMRNGD